MKIHFYTIDGLHLRFNLNSHLPEIDQNMDAEVKELKEEIFAVCDEHIEDLKQNNSPKSTTEKSEYLGWFSFQGIQQGVKNVIDTTTKFVQVAWYGPDSTKEIAAIHKIKALFQQPQMPDKETLIAYLENLCTNLNKNTTDKIFADKLDIFLESYRRSSLQFSML